MLREVRTHLIDREVLRLEFMELLHKCPEWEAACQVWEAWEEEPLQDRALQVVCQQVFQLVFLQIFNKWHKTWTQP